ncbi:hypothetical protein HZI73_18715 [Vallitalea pronyensis]|uniref:Glycoside hydrolase family 3 N-terminal domain-containing protein n=1 Tax=Vallitalea pronyensis TaxID=1348613 RepID=A0A8J8MMX6_9FIRM|nr:glycoside hydrolase family 3 N-terminal domain-containing protein [Vallitalea pronyensis]QUI24198.1 hypothetical protein HZI73_18715 [Vallitalea pronyensis]
MEKCQKQIWVDNIFEKLTLEQKVGQLMVFGFAGPVITPHIIEMIKTYHVGGFRIAQKFHGGYDSKEGAHPSLFKEPDSKSYDRPGTFKAKRVACTPQEYATTLNTLRDLAMEHNDGVPLHFTFDQEGEGADFLFGQRLFPFPMGLAATKEPEMAYKVALSLGKQARALGANMIHSPVLDVNTNPLNPEIGPRAYSDKTDTVIAYAKESIRGFNEMHIISTGKHFPGRGDSVQDAHFGLPVIDLSKAELMEKHIRPYRELIKAGLPAIMAAFTAYPSLDPSHDPAATSRAIITGLLREELGFKGVITTDNISMHGLLDRYEVGEAVVRSLLAGCDLILCRNETPVNKYIIGCVIEAVKTGRYSMDMLDASVMRILKMRYDMGLADNGGKVNASEAGLPFYDEEIMAVAREAAEKSVTVLRDKGGLLPVSKDKKVLLIEQTHHFHSFINNMYVHPGVLWEEMLKHSDHVSVVVVKEKVSKACIERIKGRLKHEKYDLIVTTSYYNYRTHANMMEVMDLLCHQEAPVIVVSNTPYEKFGVPKHVNTAIVSFCPSGRENIKAIADVIYGSISANHGLELEKH